MPLSLQISSNLTQYAGSFNGSFRDATGTFGINNGYEIEVYEDLTKKFGGYIQKWKREAGTVYCNGLDYTSILTKVYVNEVYYNTAIHSIVLDLITKYASNITTTNVYTTTTTPTEIRFRNVQLFKALKDLSKYDNCDFYVDQNKDLHFNKLGTTDSGIDLVYGTNIINDRYDKLDDKLINKVKITGGREDYIKTETATGNGSTTEFTLTYRPINVRVLAGGIEKIGFKEGMKSASEYDYTTNKENKKIVFNTAPGNGVSLSFEYTYSSPVIVQSQEDESISSYKNVYEKVIYDETINKKSEAQDLAAQILAKYKDPIQTGTVNTRLNLSPAVGQTVDVSNPKKGISGTFIIVGLKHNIFSGRITVYELASLQDSVVEFLSQLAQRVEALEEGQRGDVDIISYLRQFTDEAKGNDDPANNLSIRTRTVNTTNTWYFAKPHLFSEPILFGGGSGVYGSNLVTNPSN
ncbi:MAG: hypothetical protein AB1467_06840 [Candidatus Diapherotrites archaeon]